MAAAGLWMFALVAAVMIATGLPAFIVLIGVAVLFALVGVTAGALPYELLTALPWRVLGLLESDLLQALPLYVLMGALLNRLPLADTLFRAGNALFARTPAAPLLSALGLGALLAPMNGSVGAGVATLSRVVHPRLVARGGRAEPCPGLRRQHARRRRAALAGTDPARRRHARRAHPGGDPDGAPGTGDQHAGRVPRRARASRALPASQLRLGVVGGTRRTACRHRARRRARLARGGHGARAYRRALVRSDGGLSLCRRGGGGRRRCALRRRPRDARAHLAGAD